MEKSIHIIYESIPIILNKFNKVKNYSHKTYKINKNDIVDFINNINKKTNNMENLDWLYTIRESIIYFLKNYAIFTEDSFNIILCDNDNKKIKLELFILYLIFYNFDALSENKNKNMYVGIDFEFNDHKVALCQLAFFPYRNNKFIFVFDPSDLSTKQSNYLIAHLFTSKYIIKLLHGSDSLDIPYIFQDLFMGNTTYIFDFLCNLIDTRFMCEYSKIIDSNDNSKKGDINKKCSIYDALLYFDVIDKSKYNELLSINKSMESSTKSDGDDKYVWDVNKMSKKQLRYAIYDVLYFMDFYTNIMKKSDSGIIFIPIFTRLVFMEKWGITNLLDVMKTDVDLVNNYIVRYNNKSYTLIQIFNHVNNDEIKIEINNKNIYIKDLLEINYFKSTIIVILKYVVYYIVINDYDVFMTKTKQFDGEFQLDDVYATFKTLQVPELRKFVTLFFIQAHTKINKLLQ